MKKNTVEAELANYTGKLLRDNFGKGPTSVYVSIKGPFVTIYLRGFLAPMERVLISQSNELKVEQTRDFMMKELIPDLKATIKSVAQLDAGTIYYDWNLSDQTGIIFASVNSEDPIPENDYPIKDAIHKEINRFSIQAEKKPEEVESLMLNERTLVIERRGILVDIEKQLISNGFVEELRLSKRQLEKSFLASRNLKSIFENKMEDVFVDWNFELDISYIIVILKPNTV